MKLPFSLKWRGFGSKSADFRNLPVSKQLDILSGICAGASRWGEVMPSDAFRYYASLSPVGRGANLIAQEFMSIRPQFYDMKADEWVPFSKMDNGMIQLSKIGDAPNPEDTGMQFREKLSINGTVTGNTYIEVQAMSATAKPTFQFAINPKDVSPVKDFTGKISHYVVNIDGGQKTYHRTEVGRKTKYLTANGAAELQHVARYNPIREHCGLSPLNPVFYEISQYEQSGIHNLSVLKNGGTLGLVMLLRDDITTADQAREFTELFKEKFSGAASSGEPLVAGGAKDVKDYGQKIKDMDFYQLRSDAREQIFNMLGIPLPLINTSSMTLDNYKEAKRILYLLTVIPTANSFWSSYLNMNADRFGIDTSRYSLKVNKSTIPIFEEEEAKLNNELSTNDNLTINEARALLGYEPLAEGGDVISKPSSMVIVGAASKSAAAKDPERMREVLAKMTAVDGSPRFSKSDIERIIGNACH